MLSINRKIICLDQLAFALEQFEKRESSYGRFAHILTDNAVELMLHYQAEAILSDMFFHPQVGPKDDKAKAKILGNRFLPKVKLAREAGVITSDESEYIRINHELRNELYHVGLQHEEIIYEVAWYYHTFACELLEKIKFGITSFSWPFSVPSRIRKRWEDEEKLHKGKYEPMVVAIAREIKQKPQEVSPLGKTLGKKVEQQIHHLDKAIDWIVANDRKAGGRLQVIIEAQLWSIMFDKERQKNCRRLATPDQAQAIMANAAGDPVKRLKLIIAPPIVNDPIVKWRKLARDLIDQKDTIQSLIKYHRLICQMSDLDADIMRQAGALEMHLEYLRGK